MTTDTTTTPDPALESLEYERARLAERLEAAKRSAQEFETDFLTVVQRVRVEKDWCGEVEFALTEAGIDREAMQRAKDRLEGNRRVRATVTVTYIVDATPRQGLSDSDVNDGFLDRSIVGFDRDSLSLDGDWQNVEVSVSREVEIDEGFHSSDF